MDISRKTALVTGAAGGIGRAACERLSKNGWRVLAVDRNSEGLAWTRSATDIVAHVADISIEQDNHAMVAKAEQYFGTGLDAILLNAAVEGGGSIDALPLEEFHKIISINLFGAVLGIRAALPALRRRKSSAILITSSTMGLAGDANNWAYSTSKHALIGLVMSLSRELGWQGIRINAICPGLTRGTGMTRKLESDMPAVYSALSRASPLQRWAEPEEMAAVMEFLVSPAASYVNGIAMAVDGGAITGTGLAPPAAG